MTEIKKVVKGSPIFSTSPHPVLSEEDNGIVPHAPLSFLVLVTALSLREKNGLRHNDYHRYRGFCSRKLFRLRNSLHFKCGRNRYVQKAFPQQFNDIRYLMIILMSAERAWSFGMQLKADNAAAQIYNPRARRHALRKFAKAAKYAKTLEHLCIENCDKKTCIDAQAYSDWLHGTMHMEKEEWRKAADNLKNSHLIFSQLKRISLNQNNEHLLFASQLEEIEGGIRLCRYHLERSGIDCNEFLDLVPSAEVNPKNSHMLMAVGAVKEDGVLTYRGVQVQPPSEKISMMLKGLLSLMESRCVKIEKNEKVKSKTKIEEKVQQEWWNFCAELTSNALVERYGEVSNLLNDLLREIHSEMIHSESGNAKSAWNSTEGYTTDLLNCIDIERNAALEILFLQKIKTASEEGNGWRIRHDEGVRYADLLKQSLQLQLDSKMLSEDSEVLFLQMIEILRMTRAICLSFFNASLHKFSEAFVLADWVVSLGEYELPINSFDHSDPYGRLSSIFVILQEAVIFHANRLKCICLANAINEEFTEIGKKNLDSNAVAIIENSISKSGKFPPKMKPIPCKPLLLDLAILDVQEPIISARLPQKRTGFMGRLKSIWKF